MWSYRLQIEHYFKRKCIVDKDADNDIMFTRKCYYKVSLHVWSCDFYDTMLSTK